MCVININSSVIFISPVHKYRQFKSVLPARLADASKDVAFSVACRPTKVVEPILLLSRVLSCTHASQSRQHCLHLLCDVPCRLLWISGRGWRIYAREHVLNLQWCVLPYSLACRQCKKAACRQCKKAACRKCKKAVCKTM